MEASTEIAVTCDVDAPSAMAFWKRSRSSCHWRCLAWSRHHRNNAQLLPEFGDGAENSGFRHLAAERMPQLRDGGVARLKMLVGLDGQRRNLARSRQLRAAPPVAIAAKSIDVGQNPSRHNEIRLLARLSKQVQANGHAFRFEANQQVFRQGDNFGCREPSSAHPLRLQQRLGQ